MRLKVSLLTPRTNVVTQAQRLSECYSVLVPLLGTFRGESAVNIMNRSLFFSLSTLVGLVLSVDANSEVYVDLRSGQEWSYETRAQDVRSTVVVGQIEDHPELGTIVHAVVRNVAFGHESWGVGSLETLSHVPVSELSFRESLVALISEGGDVSEVREGIDVWRDADGGVFSLSLKEIVQIVEDSRTEPDRSSQY